MATSLEVVNGFVGELGAKLGHPGLTLSDHGTCTFAFSDDMEFTVEAETTGSDVHFFADITTVPAGLQSEVLSRVLAENLSLRETQGLIFALDPQKNTIVLRHTLQVDGMEQSQFEGVIESMLSICKDWHDKLSSDLEGGIDTKPQDLSPAILGGLA